MFYLIIIGLALLVSIYFLLRKSPLDGIPGPKPWPIIGNVLELDNKKPFLSLRRLAKKYGGIFKLVLLGKPVIVLNDPDTIYEALVGAKSSVFSGRPTTFRFNLFSTNQSGIIFTDASPILYARRKLMQAFLKQFGSGMKKIEEVTMVATDEMMQRILKEDSHPVNMRDILFHCTSDIIAIMLIGETLNETDIKDLETCLCEMVKALERTISGEFLDMFPFLRFFGNSSYRTLLSTNELKYSLIKKWFTDKPANGFIHHLQSLSDDDKQHNGVGDEKYEIEITWDFLAAGVFTTATTLTILVNILAHMPEIQDKLRDEVHEVIGSSRSLTLQDRASMPYHQATLLEIGRFDSFAAQTAPHKTVSDTSLSGYPIPAGTEVLINLWNMHHDDRLWKDPFIFNPERYLDENGMLVAADHPNRKNTMPFGAGNRVCVGEVLALSRMFLILSRLIQNFVIHPETTVAEQPSMDPRHIELARPLYKVRLIPVQ